MRIIRPALAFLFLLLACSCSRQSNPKPAPHTPTSTSQLHTRERNTGAVVHDKMAKTTEERLDWTKLPAELQYLARPAEKYGRYQFDDKIDEFLFHKMTPEDKLELISLSAKFGRDGRLIDQWLDRYNIKVHPEARLVYFTMCLVGTAADSGLLGKGK